MEAFHEKDVQKRVSSTLRKLGFPVYRNGFRCLRYAIPRFSQDPNQSITKELYPYVAERLQFTGWMAVEKAVREAISAAWKNRDPKKWEELFPGCEKAPSNKQLIATLAELLCERIES
ncbi:MAG: hypothetical protein E7435_01135 [Ruminococcaceae bacterium]|nr:hypothetical protein [Oscillospiraceae bacterium]